MRSNSLNRSSTGMWHIFLTVALKVSLGAERNFGLAAFPGDFVGVLAVLVVFWCWFCWTMLLKHAGMLELGNCTVGTLGPLVIAPKAILTPGGGGIA